jgi:hypothetical protein
MIDKSCCCCCPAVPSAPRPIYHRVRLRSNVSSLTYAQIDFQQAWLGTGQLVLSHCSSPLDVDACSVWGGSI